jgi:hypothetical protein
MSPAVHRPSRYTATLSFIETFIPIMQYHANRDAGGPIERNKYDRSTSWLQRHTAGAMLDLLAVRGLGVTPTRAAPFAYVASNDATVSVIDAATTNRNNA